MLIEDGTGSGRTARITLENRIASDSIAIPMTQHVNQYHGRSYQIYTAQTPSVLNPSDLTTNGCIMYIKNTDDLDMTILEVRIWVESNEYVDMYASDTGTPTDGTTITPVNMNLGSGNSAAGTFLVGTDINGLTRGTLIDRLRVPADNSDHNFQWKSNIILPKNDRLSFYVGTGEIPIEITMAFYYHGKI